MSNELSPSVDYILNIDKDKKEKSIIENLHLISPSNVKKSTRFLDVFRKIISYYSDMKKTSPLEISIFESAWQIDINAATFFNYNKYCQKHSDILELNNKPYIKIEDHNGIWCFNIEVYQTNLNASCRMFAYGANEQYIKWYYDIDFEEFRVTGKTPRFDLNLEEICSILGLELHPENFNMSLKTQKELLWV